MRWGVVVDGWTTSAFTSAPETAAPDLGRSSLASSHRNHRPFCSAAVADPLLRLLQRWRRIRKPRRRRGRRGEWEAAVIALTH